METITKLTFLDVRTAEEGTAEVAVGPGYVSLALTLRNAQPLTVTLPSDDCSVVASALGRALERLHGAA
jgi:hypothetical protein